MREQAVIVQVMPVSILVEDDYGETFPVLACLVTGCPRVGATVTLVKGSLGLRAFVEPEEKRSNPDQSGVQTITRGPETLRVMGE